MAKIPLLALGLSLIFVSCSASKVPEASSAASSGDDAKLKDGDAASKKSTKTGTSTSKDESDDSSDSDGDGKSGSAKDSSDGLDLTRVEKDADECKASNKYYDLSNTKCTGTLLSSFTCTNTALLGSSSKIKSSIDADRWATFQDHYKNDFPGFQFKFCFPAKNEKGESIYRLVAWKKTSDEIKTQPFDIPNHD